MIFSSQILQSYQKIFTTLQQKNLVITTAESCTGGFLSALFTELDGSSKIFDRGFVVYSNNSKISMLNVDARLLESHGAVSQEVCLAMAYGALKNSLANIAIAITGIAGPQGGTLEKPVGTVFISVVSNKNYICEKFSFGNLRELNRQKSLETSLNLLNIFLKNKI